MTTPICDFVDSYKASAPIRMHMPGHKGRCSVFSEDRDITEINGADVLYHAKGIIWESEQNAAGLFGAERTIYSTEGSSLPIRAMLYLVQMYAASMGKKACIAAARNAHKVFISAAALLNIDVQWICQKETDDIVSCLLSAEQIDDFLSKCIEKPEAVYITSPDYLGNIADIAGIAKVCRERGCLLLVDNAHGSYLKFLPQDIHPITLGADLCCDSAHKTLPVLTGGAYLHISRKAPGLFSELAEQAMALFASTSPSYLIMQSLDRCNEYLCSFPQKLAKVTVEWAELKDTLSSAGFCLAGQEPLKLSILPKSYGYTGFELAELLEKQNIFCEFSDEDHLVFMLPVDYEKELPALIANIFVSIPEREAIKTKAPAIRLPEKVLSAHNALFSPSSEINIAEAEEKIMAEPCVSCPPAIPIVVYGERINASAINAMKYYGIEKIRVVSEPLSSNKGESS